jgi:hypothetical protein
MPHIKLMTTKKLLQIQKRLNKKNRVEGGYFSLVSSME